VGAQAHRDILNRYRTYSVTIEGFANNIGKIYGYSADRIQKEENTEVLPLSKARAEAVRTYLISLGVASSRLTAAGMGSARPVVDPRDAENRWKNRRVEFILQK
jgi:outer membrane protein OmpA-like peptidoglycan-associated protein